MLIEGHDVGIELPPGWDGRVRSRPRTELPLASSVTQSFATPLRSHLITAHAANFALPPGDGDFGTGATAAMPPSGVFTSLVEYQPGGGLEPGVGLYDSQGVPQELTVAEFDPDAMLRAQPGQAGAQRFFTAAGRPFCLFAAIGSRRRARALVPQVNALLAGVRIG
jgi:hypothetical protein